ncbi:MAG: SMC-Scp complex subunit ScpB [Lachnospiraceae bacterium]|nr:SMC-Scp complex subunit ScpB [Lachnospiraceae bacterium]
MNETEAENNDAEAVETEAEAESNTADTVEDDNANSTAEAENNDADTASENSAEDLTDDSSEDTSDDSAEDTVEDSIATTVDDEPEGNEKAGKPEHPEAAIEAILFAYGNSVSAERLCETLSLTEEELEAAVDNLKRSYEESGRGITITRLEDSYQLGTKAEYYDYLVRLAKHPKRYSLTDTVIETLSIIAYKQPVTRGEIERIRGVSSDHAINRLIEYELIEEVGRLDAPGKPLLFGTTEQFLRAFGVDSLKDLPEMSAELKEEFKEQAEAEAGVESSDEEGVIVDV